MKHPTRKKGDARRQRQRLLLLHFNVWKAEKTREFERALLEAQIQYQTAANPDAKTRAHTRLHEAYKAALVARAKYNLGLYVEEELNGCRS